MKYYVIRGGSWGISAFNCRTAFRYSYAPDFRYYYMGFRLTKKLKS